MESIYNKKMKNPKFKKIMKGLKEAEEGKIITYSSVGTMLKDLDKNRTILDDIRMYWHRYFWNYVSEIPLNIKTFIQRGQRGWGNSDTWSFDYYLAKVISEGIRHLLKYGNSAWTKKDLNAIKTIATTFETVLRIENDRDRYIPSKEFTWKEYKRAKRHYKVMQKKYKGRYHVMTLREVKRFEKGFDLFKEYYFHLWD